MMMIPIESTLMDTEAACGLTAVQLVEGLENAYGERDFVLYEDGASSRIAWGKARELLLLGDEIVVRDGRGNVTSRERAHDPLQQIGRLLKGETATAYGYIAFDVARFYYPYSKRGSMPAVHLVVPEIECKLRGGTLRVDGANPSDLLRAMGEPADRTAEWSAIDPPSPSAREQEAFLSRVRELQAAIRREELEKAIISRRVTLSARLDLLGTYFLSYKNGAVRRYAFRMGSLLGVGSCPEIVLRAEVGRRRSDHVVTTSPLAGTKPRGVTPEEDQRLLRELFADAKEVREHAISVRLAEEEIASVSVPDTVRIHDFMSLREYTFVRHLSTRVSGVLKETNTVWDALRAVFPGVTCSGVDKKTAISWIDALESHPRGVYGGAVGWYHPSGVADFGLTLRSVFEHEGNVVLNAGAGIVSNSDPESEFLESENKMRTMSTRLVLR